MKKYWKLIILGVLIVGLLAAHYIQTAQAAKNILSLKLETIQGDESAVKDITLYGHYNQNALYQPAKVTLEGSTTPLRSTYIHNLFSTYMPTELQSYMENYRSFMRGKVNSLTNYVEDEKRITYVNVINNEHTKAQITFEVATVVKESKEEHSFEATIDTTENEWADIMDLQFVDGFTYVFTQNFTRDNKQELHLYIIDEAKQKAISDTIIAKVQSVGDKYANFYFYTNEILKAPSHFLYSLYEENFDGDKTTNVKQDWFIFDLANKTSTPLELPKRLEDNISNVTPSDDGFYILSQVDRVIYLYHYTFADGEWHQSTLEENVPKTIYQAFNFDNRLFISSENAGNTFVYVYDVNSSSLIYQGKVVNESSDAQFDYSINYMNKTK